MAARTENFVHEPSRLLGIVSAEIAARGLSDVHYGNIDYLAEFGAHACDAMPDGGHSCQ